MASGNKTNPGNVRMKCMLWEPRPILQRVLQDLTFVYNAATMSVYPNAITRELTLFNGEPSGIYLREKYIYRDTFLRIGKETLNSERENMRDSVGEKLFDTDGTPKRSYIYHQSFSLAGSLFSPNIATPTGIRKGNTDALDNGLSKWTYEWADCPFDTGGNADEETSDGEPPTDLKYVKWRENRRLMPLQIAVSQESKLTTSTSSGGTVATVSSKPIHWLALKDEPLYQGQDFFVEFRRRAYAPDIAGNEQVMLDSYKFLDVRTAPMPIGCGTAPINAGVVDVDSTGQIAEKSKDLFDLHAQPYYLIELGHRDPNHNYFILLSYNANPVFIHAGQFPVLVPGDGTTPPVLCSPGQASDGQPALDPAVTMSRKLSVYELSSKQLMNKDVLRITVRNHMGRIVVIFDGHEDKPWVISRSDFTTPTSTDAAQTDFVEKFKPMVVANAPIQIGAGNMKVGFMYAPLHYEETSTFTLPQAICVRGPLEDTDVNMFLREKSVTTVKSGPPVPQYFQDAEIYFELEKGVKIYKERIKSISTTEQLTMRAKGKDTFPTDQEFVANKNGNWLSYIAIEKISKLAGSEESPTQDENEENADDNEEGETSEIPPTKYVQFFNAQYTLRAGDFTFPEHEREGKTIPEFRLWNCITPIANGWRLYVPPSKETYNIEPIDVAHHVTSFSSNYSYTDNTKIDHSGNIKFLLNFGQQTGTVNTANVTGTGEAPANTGTLTDYSSYIASLNDKTFFLRIYAWWEGGYMSCQGDSNCPCRRGTNGGNEHQVIFTGLCHGGEITVRGNERSMDCQLLDYMKILQDTQFLNSPFFDGMRDFNACHNILQTAGFADAATNNSPDKYPPAELIKNLADSKSPRPTGLTPTGEPYSIPQYALPSSYDILQAPFFKMGDGSKYDEAITKIAQLSGKVAYFDRHGIFHLDERADIKWAASRPEQRRAKCQFFSSPKDIPNQSCSIYDVLALNQYTYKRGAADVVNEIHILSATPEGELVIGSGVNHAGKFDPSKPGYVGYTKRLLQMDGIFGSLEAVRNVVKYYEGFFIPPIIVTWESMGIAKLQAMDIISFSGLRLDDAFPPANNPLSTLPTKTVHLIITSLSTEINAEKNTWTNKYEGEWIFTGEIPNELLGSN